MYKVRAREKSGSKKDFDTESSSCDNIKTAKAFIVLTVILIITGIDFSILLTLSVENKLIFTTATNTTNSSSANKTSISNASILQIGASCMYNYQCPRYAFCEGTCKCPFHYYFNTSAICTMIKTNEAGCSNDFECNTNIGLTCQSGTCQCDSVHFWNSTYVLGGGLPNGRCQNRYVGLRLYK
jgi:hypothetical protein